MQQTIFLGGKISGIHAEFKELALYDPDTAFCIWYIENRKKLQSTHGLDRLVSMLKTLGKLELLRASTELTKLSMIVGDTTKQISVKEEIDRLRLATRDIPNTEQ